MKVRILLNRSYQLKKNIPKKFIAQSDPGVRLRFSLRLRLQSAFSNLKVKRNRKDVTTSLEPQHQPQRGPNREALQNYMEKSY